MKTRIILLIFGISVSISCKENVEKRLGHLTDNLIRFETQFKRDTLNADNYNILFFHPIESELNVMLEEYGESSGLYEVDSDFGFYTSKVYDSLSTTDLKVKYVTEETIKYSTNDGTEYFDRIDNENQPYGIIFNKMNCNPKIVFGVVVDIEIYQILNEYYKSCN